VTKKPELESPRPKALWHSRPRLCALPGTAEGGYATYSEETDNPVLRGALPFICSGSIVHWRLLTLGVSHRPIYVPG